MLAYTVYPVGRLDYDSEGLLLLTNDGALTNALTHPKKQVAKTYRVRVAGMPTREKLDKLAKGIMLEDGVTAPAKILLVHQLNGNALLEITIIEGKNRQIRRMCAAIGHPVLRLVRTRIGSLELRQLASGVVRELKKYELKELEKTVKFKLSPKY